MYGRGQERYNSEWSVINQNWWQEFYVYSTKWKQQVFQGTNRESPKHYGDTGKEKPPFNRKKLEEQALGGVPICHDWLGVNTQNKEKLWTKLQFHIQYIIFVLYYFTKPSSDEFKDVIKNVMKEVCGCSFWCAISNLVLLYICCMLLNCDCLTAATGEVSQCFWCQWDQGIK